MEAKKVRKICLKNSVTLVGTKKITFWSVFLFYFILQPVTKKITKNNTLCLSII